jgi:hypothetical protein
MFFDASKAANELILFIFLVLVLCFDSSDEESCLGLTSYSISLYSS